MIITEQELRKLHKDIELKYPDWFYRKHQRKMWDYALISYNEKDGFLGCEYRLIYDDLPLEIKIDFQNIISLLNS